MSLFSERTADTGPKKGGISIGQQEARGGGDVDGKLRQAEVALAQGMAVPDVCRRLGVAEQTYYRWRKEYGGLGRDQARRLKDLERETPG